MPPIIHRHVCRLNPPEDYVKHAKAVEDVIHREFPDAQVQVLYGTEPLAEVSIAEVNLSDDPKAWARLETALYQLAGPDTRASAEASRMLFDPEVRQQLRDDPGR
jgi:hypothetical protein